MKILIVSAGLPPRHEGGLPSYVAEVIDELVARGHRVVYLDTSHRDGRPWSRVEAVGDGNPTVHRLYNSSAWVQMGLGTREPNRDVVPSHRVRSLVLDLVRRESPDLVHVHELLGFPVGLLADVRGLGCPVVFTAQDYFPLCPTIQLFHAGDYRCDLPAERLDCDHCCGGARPALIGYLDRVLPNVRGRTRAQQVACSLSRTLAPPTNDRIDYVRRRVDFVRALNGIDQVVCMSACQLEIFQRAGVSRRSSRLMRLSRRTFRTTAGAPRPPTPADPFVIFGSNLSGVQKGRQVIEREFRILAEREVPVRLDLYGYDPQIDAPLIEYKGLYSPADLDRICSEAHVGLVPSVWYEAYGYIGPEMLSRGVPVIASTVGAMPEYVIDGENGLLFDPDQTGSMADAVSRFVADAGLRRVISAGAAKSHNDFEPFGSHVAALEDFYAELIAERSASIVG